MRCLRVLSGLLLGLMLFACASDGAPSGALCAPNTTQVCPCAAGDLGSQSCVASGVWTACNCAGGFAAAPAAGSGGGIGAAGAAGTGAAGGGGTDASFDAGLDAAMSEVGPGTIIAEPQDPAAYLFDQSMLRTFEITLADADLATIDASPGAEQYVPGTLRFEGTDYPNVGVRYKGSAGAFLAPCTSGLGGIGAKMGKCSIKVAFDKYDDEGRFYGVKKLNFHSLNNDDSLLRDRLGYALFREMDIAAPRAVHVRLLINGELEGLFALVEQIDGRFTRARFSEGGKGNLYKEVWPIHGAETAYLNALESNRNDQPTAQRMLAFKDAIAQGAEPAAAFLDRDYILRYLAVDRVIENDDGIMQWWCTSQGQGNNPGGIGNHNYYWYEAEHVDRVWLLPWDLDHAFGTTSFVHVSPEWSAQTAGSCSCGIGGFGSSLRASCDPLIKHFISWLADYELAVDAFLSGPFAVSNVDAKLAAWTAQIQAAVQESAGLGGAPSLQSWQSAVQTLRNRIASQRQNRGYAY